MALSMNWRYGHAQITPGIVCEYQICSSTEVDNLNRDSLGNFTRSLGVFQAAQTDKFVYDLDRFHRKSYTNMSVWAPCKAPKARVKFPKIVPTTARLSRGCFGPAGSAAIQGRAAPRVDGLPGKNAHERGPKRSAYEMLM